MSTLEIFRRQLDQERWAHARIADAIDRAAAQGLPEHVLAQCREKLAHVIEAREIWMERLGSRGAASADPFPEQPTTDDLRAWSARALGRWSAYLDGAPEAELDRVVTYTVSAGGVYDTAVHDVLMHVATHGYHHGGQIGLLLNRAGAEPPQTGHAMWARTTG
jgi:uncharacterized damage-inducible protein DinB